MRSDLASKPSPVARQVRSQMEKAFFENLLHEDESSTLDVKSAQYPFAKATDEQKSEFLKDLLGFANAWRRAVAYILIGVEEIRGGRDTVVGIPVTDQLADHSLQQFVNSLTNRPLRFGYEAFCFEGVQVGIIRIERQPRPFYLTRNYGKLRKGEVYIRRGTSTDPSNPATPEEIAQMGKADDPQSADLVVEFADIASDNSLGDKLTWDVEFLVTPPRDQIPDLNPPSHKIAGSPFPMRIIDPFNRVNPNYLRERAEFEYIQRLFRPVRLVVQNVGEVASKSVRCELSTRAGVDVWVIDTAELPDAPEYNWSVVRPARIMNIKPISRQTPGDVTINKNDERYLIEIDCGDLQPGRRVWSDVFYVGKGESGEVELAGRIYAENLPQPKEFMLAISVKVNRTSMTVNELRNLPEPST